MNKLLAVACILLMSVALAVPAMSEPLRIGVSLALSGEFSVLSHIQKKGYELWEKDVNSRGGILGRQIKLIIHDDRSDPVAAAALYEQMMERESVDFVFGPYSTRNTEAVLPLAEKYRYPLLIGGAAGDSLWEKGYRYAIGVYTPSGKFSSGFLELAVMAGLNNIAVVYADDSFSKDLAASAELWAKRFGMKIVLAEGFKKGTVRLDDLAKKVRDAKAEILMVCGHFDEAVNMRLALKNISWSPRAFYASVGPPQRAFYDRLGKDADQVFSTSLWELRADFPGARQFYDAFVSTYHEEPGYHAALAFATGQVLETAIKKAGSFDREKIRNSLFSLDTVTIIGRYGIDQAGKQIRQHNFIIQWQGAAKQIVWPESIRTARPAFR